MSHTRWLQCAAAGPVLVLLLIYALMGWLDPAYWLVAPADMAVRAMTPASSPLGHSAAKPKRTAPVVRPAPPWPDEAAMRLQLARRDLRLTGFQTGPQRTGAAEVRVTLQWQGRLGPSLQMLQTLALDTPQMALDALVLQALPQAEWRVIWRGQWQHLTVPHPLPPRPAGLDAWTDGARSRLFDPSLLRRELARLWPLGQPAQGVLHMARPEDLRLVAVVRQPEPLAWVSWQQHTLTLRVGDRIGDAGARVQVIEPDQVRWVQGGRTYRITPAVLTEPLGDLR